MPVEDITRHCSRLQSLTTGGKVTLSDATIREILKQKHKLSALSLLNYSQLSDASYLALTELELNFLHLQNSIITHQPLLKLALNLQKLVLQNCSEVTEPILRDILKSCPSLDLEVRDCSNASQKELEVMQLPSHWIIDFFTTLKPEGYIKLIVEIEEKGSLAVVLDFLRNSNLTTLALNKLLMQVRKFNPVLQFPHLLISKRIQYYRFCNDLFEQAKFHKCQLPLTYEDFCQIVEADLTLTVGCKEFKVHRSVLMYYPYWAVNLGRGNHYVVNLECDPDLFKILLNWFYTQHLPWNIQANREIYLDDLGQYLDLELNYLSLIEAKAEQFQAAALVEVCQKRRQMLQESRGREFLYNAPLILGPRDVYIYNEFDPSNAYHEGFRDVFFECKGSLFSANRPQLSMRSMFFNKIMLQQDHEGTKVDPYILTPDDFPLSFYKALHPKVDSQSIDRKDALKILAIAQQDNLGDLVQKCCDMLLTMDSFKDLSQEELALIDHVKIDRDWNVKNQNHIQHLLAVRSLVISKETEFTQDIIEAIKRWGKDLRSIDFRGCGWVTDGHLKQIGESCPYLQRIYLDDCSSITDKGIIALTSCHYLQVLSLTRCINTSNVAIAAIARNCFQLVELQLDECFWVNAAMRLVGQNCHFIEILNLSKNYIQIYEDIKIVAQNCPRLMQFTCCTYSNTKKLYEIKRNFRIYCPNLKQENLKLYKP